MLKKMTQASIGIRLPVLIVVALTILVVLMGYSTYKIFQSKIEAHAVELAESTALHSGMKAKAWIDELNEEINALAEDRTTKEALRRFSFSLQSSKDSGLEALRQAYIDNNPNPPGERRKLDEGADGTAYDFVHKELHSQFRRINDRSGYYDLFLITSDGAVAYSVTKESDFATSVVSGPFAKSGLGDAFNRAMVGDAAASVFADFAPYAPSSNQPASFLAKAVIDDAGRKIGVVAIQLPISAISAILTSASDLGSDDEVYLGGADGLARSASLNPGLLEILDPLPNLPQIDAVRSREEGYFDNIQGISGKFVVAFVTSFDVMGEPWSVVVEYDHEAMFAELDLFRNTIFGFVTAGILMSLIMGYFIAASITRPLQAFSTSMKQVSEEDYETSISGVNRLDEIGNLARVLETFKQKLLASRNAKKRLDLGREEQEQVVQDLGDRLKSLASGDLSTRLETPFPQDYEQLRDDFNSTASTMNDLMNTIVGNANEIQTRAEEISASSDDLSQRTESQAATLEETVAALDELTSSVRQAADGATEVEQVVTEAREKAEDSRKVVTEAVEAMSLINQSSTEISQIIGVIDDIAFQTNLLSLNAGVEAARVGEAGRGFAVVASEVRALAQRSSDSAKEIKELINSSTEQVDMGVNLVDRTGTALRSIVDRVENIDERVSDIATGAREQSIALGEINVGMNQLDQVTQQNAAMAEEATAAALALKNESRSLNQIVARFKLNKNSEVPVEETSIVQFGIAPILSPVSEPPQSQPLYAQIADGQRWQDF